MAEHSTVNRRVTGSSPVGGAKLKASELRSEAFPFSRRDSNAVTTALGAGAGAPTPNFVWSSPVGGAYKARTPEASSRGFLLYLFLWLEPVTTPPYALGAAKIFGSSRARKIFASLVRVQSERSLRSLVHSREPVYEARRSRKVQRTHTRRTRLPDTAGE